MRFSSLVFQGLIAGAILFLPSEVFAEKGKTISSQHAKNFSKEKNENAVNKGAAHARPQGQQPQTVQKASVNRGQSQLKNSQKQQVKKSLPPASNAHGKVQQVPVQKRAAIQKNSVIKPVTAIKAAKPKSPAKPVMLPEKQTAPHLPLKVQTASKAKVKNLHKRQDLFKPEQQKQRPLPADDPYIPQEEGVLLQAVQSLKSASKEKEGGGKSSNFSKGLIYCGSAAEEKAVQPCFFTRLDLLRNQWVNAPPSEPPKNALDFSI
ncbi:hypothetical protein ACFFJY_18395 [Fictibacillus aquaticus]|uniref:Uncharacterized protein n=1 Tax=Fictibacillus aquaticus TaxID=2021314 RepID=A0A235F5J0_9BACL|nr:hypothetical protein [Fictibacillus aquaticus]OYD56488.1 hypothetical protein CGZ90_15870 [Fictibacillus aquaticus]